MSIKNKLTILDNKLLDLEKIQHRCKTDNYIFDGNFLNTNSYENVDICLVIENNYLNIPMGNIFKNYTYFSTDFIEKLCKPNNCIYILTSGYISEVLYSEIVNINTEYNVNISIITINDVEIMEEFFSNQIYNDNIELEISKAHTLYVDKNNNVMGIGNNIYGQLCNYNGDISKITDIKSNYYSVGGFHSAIIDLDANVYVFGRNNYGQLGLDDNIDRNTPTLLGINNIVKIALGNYHSLFLDSDGKVYGCGKNSNGQLGLGNNLDYNTPQLISRLTNIIDIQCGGEHSLVLDKDGKVYSFGLNDYGQLGLNNRISYNIPKLMNDMSRRYRNISAGYKHSAFIDFSSNIYTCGMNYKGQLGVSDTSTRLAAKKVKYFLDYPLNIKCGNLNTLVLTKDYLYITGSNKYKESLNKYYTNKNNLVFYRHQLRTNLQIKDIIVSGYTIMCVNVNQFVYIFGYLGYNSSSNSELIEYSNTAYLTGVIVKNDGNLSSPNPNYITTQVQGLGTDGENSNVPANAPAFQIGYSPEFRLSEKLIFNFNFTLIEFNVEINNLFHSEGEIGKYTIYRNGYSIAYDTFMSQPSQSSMNLQIKNDIPFNKIVFECLPYLNQGDNLVDSSDYFVKPISYKKRNSSNSKILDINKDLHYNIISTNTPKCIINNKYNYNSNNIIELTDTILYGDLTNLDLDNIDFSNNRLLFNLLNTSYSSSVNFSNTDITNVKNIDYTRLSKRQKFQLLKNVNNRAKILNNIELNLIKGVDKGLENVNKNIRVLIPDTNNNLDISLVNGEAFAVPIADNNTLTLLGGIKILNNFIDKTVVNNAKDLEINHYDSRMVVIAENVSRLLVNTNKVYYNDNIEINTIVNINNYLYKLSYGSLLAEPLGWVNCFLYGTQILTTNGYIYVQDLKIGDKLITGNKGTTAITKIVVSYYSTSMQTNPYKIPMGKYGAFIDTYISPYHMIYNGECLIQVRKLSDLEQVSIENIVYYHVETENKLLDIIYANGVLCETLIDNYPRSMLKDKKYRQYYYDTIIDKFSRKLPF
jgi:alpha-tubulin suppressor-like RCC1 family protein